MTCPVCQDHGAVRVRYLDGTPDDYALCLCPVGLGLRLDIDGRGRRTKTPRWMPWAAALGLPFDRVGFLEDLIDPADLATTTYPPAAPPASRIAQAVRTRRAPRRWAKGNVTYGTSDTATTQQDPWTIRGSHWRHHQEPGRRDARQHARAATAQGSLLARDGGPRVRPAGGSRGGDRRHQGPAREAERGGKETAHDGRAVDAPVRQGRLPPRRAGDHAGPRR